MKVSFAGLCLFSFLLCVFLSCDEGMEIADDIIISELSTEIADDVPQWRRVPELDITFKIPDELLTGKIAMSKTNSVDFDVSFMISLGSATFYEEHVYMADSSGMHIYVFDMDGNLLPDKTLKRKEIYSREGNRSNHAGNVDADNNIKYAVVDNGRAGSLSISDSLLGMYVHNDIFYLEILWQPAYKGSTISRYHLWWVNIVAMHLSTGEFSVIDTLPNVSWEGDKRWFEMTEREYNPEAKDFRYVKEQGLLENRNPPPSYGGTRGEAFLLFSTDEHYYILETENFVKPSTRVEGEYECHTKGYRITTRELPHTLVGYFNPDMLVHGRDCLLRFRTAILYEDTLYMPVIFAEGDEGLGTTPNTFYAFQQN